MITSNESPLPDRAKIDVEPLLEAWKLVRDFQIAMGEPAPELPGSLDGERRKLRADWMREELSEFIGADVLVDQVDSIIDLIYFALGTLCEMGVPPHEAFNAVHAANLRKLGEDGRPLFSTRGRIKKPEGWLGPETEIGEYLDRLKFTSCDADQSSTVGSASVSQRARDQ
ncbi:hypothetical protein LC092_21000 [Stappia stellulata]|uniref:hypothetical protein n=1 Tax=Stappia stellulata TaxID=71235 RepID=UPI001CD7766C|nr:hypothetical protein [Stappia stellulata]MCA1244925.1 hypothetical protein [Stappia stellulata]